MAVQYDDNLAEQRYNSSMEKSLYSEDRRHVIQIATPSLILVIALFCLFIGKVKCFSKRRALKTRLPTDSAMLEYNELLGCGSFSKVFRATYRDELMVAVKILKAERYSRWVDEKDILYEHNGHSNITELIVSTIQEANCGRRYLLILEYVEGGTLRNFLRNYTIDISKALHLMKTFSSAVSYVHSDIHISGKDKQVTAHRDIKSSNVLISHTKGCILADFGLAVKFDSHEKVYKSSNKNSQVGTPRYMSPEKLLNHLSNKEMVALLQVDIYATGLVLYEIAGRCTFRTNQGEMCVPNEYKPPYHPEVGYHPSIHRMKDVVCTKKQRPNVPEIWNSNPIFIRIQNLIKSCWHHNPAFRPQAISILRCLEAIDQLHALKRWTISKRFEHVEVEITVGYHLGGEPFQSVTL